MLLHSLYFCSTPFFRQQEILEIIRLALLNLPKPVVIHNEMKTQKWTAIPNMQSSH